MSIESEFKKFVGIAERIAVALEKPVAVPVEIDETKAIDEGFAKDETFTEICDKENEDETDEDGVEGEIISDDPKPLKITADDVKKEARILVDNFTEDRRGFEKAKKILKKLDASGLDDLVPEKYADAVNAFRKAVKAWS